MSAPQKEPIEETMWRTIKILRVFDKGSLHRHRNDYQLSSFAPARAPIFRKLSR